jgi:hypothetical protein
VVVQRDKPTLEKGADGAVAAGAANALDTELAELTGINVFHNHLTISPAQAVFPFWLSAIFTPGACAAP